MVGILLEDINVLSHFTNLNFQYKNYCINAQAHYQLFLIDAFNSNPKLLYSYVRHKKVGQPTVGPLRTIDGVLTNDSMSSWLICFLMLLLLFSQPNPAEHHLCNNSFSNSECDWSVVLDCCTL